MAHYGSRAIGLDRERIVSEGVLVVGDEQILFAGKDILPLAKAAIITDSEYMFSLPLLSPTEQQWTEHQGKFDEWLRDTRESASLWLCLMEILGDRVPVCINPPAAFEHGAMKPAALELLRRHDLAIAPSLVTNDPEAVASFVADQGSHFYASSLAPGSVGKWSAGDGLGDFDLSKEPIMIQAFGAPKFARIIAVGGKAVGSVGDSTMAGIADEQVAQIQKLLEVPWASLTFGQGSSGAVLADFSPSPDLAELNESDQQRVLAALDELVDTPEQDRQ